MKTTADYLDQLVATTGAKSDGAAGLMLGWTRASTSNYRNVKKAFDNHTCLVVSKTLKIPLETVIADMEMQREKDEKKRLEWASFAKRCASVAATFFIINTLCLVTLLATTPPATADESTTYDAGIMQSTNYAQFTRWLSLVAFQFSSLQRHPCTRCSKT